MSYKLWSNNQLNPLIIIISIIIFSISCKQEKIQDIETDTTTKNHLPDWTKNSTIYSVNFKQFSTEGTINSFSSHIPRLKDMGINIIQLSPFFTNNTAHKKDEQNSIYSIVDFNTIDPSIGTKQDLINLIDKIHAYKMKVIFEWSLDFTSKEHQWYYDFPEYYLNETISNQDSLLDQAFVQAITCSSIGLLNLENESLKDSIIQQLNYWIKNHDVNGFTFNSIKKNKFLDKLIPILSYIHSDLLLINKDIFNISKDNGAQFINFDWKLYHLIDDVANGRKSFESINDYVKSDHTQKVLKVNFITTYIENVLNGSEIERLSEAYQAFAVLIHTMEGIPYFYNGQEEPMQKRLSFCSNNNVGFNNYSALRFYRDLIRLKKDNSALWNSPSGGKMEFFQDHEYILSFKRMKDDNQVYILINMSNQEQKLRLNEPISNVKDIFKKQKLDYAKGEYIKFKPWEFIVATK